jgi:hypothetical protein
MKIMRKNLEWQQNATGSSIGEAKNPAYSQDNPICVLPHPSQDIRLNLAAIFVADNYHRLPHTVEAMECVSGAGSGQQNWEKTGTRPPLLQIATFSRSLIL